MRLITRMLSIIAALGLIIAVLPAGADDSEDTTDVALDVVEVGDGAVGVSGSVAFGVHRLESPTQGSGGEVIPAEAGGEFEGASLTSDPANPDVVEFAIQLTGSLPGLGTLPEAVIYGWNLRVDGEPVGDGDSANLEWRRMNLTGSANALELDQAADEYIVVRSCVPNPDTGGNTCGAGPRLDGAFDADASELRAQVPIAGDDGLQAAPGSVINQAELAIYHGTGLVWLTAPESDTMFFMGDFVIPDRADSVALALVPAGDDVEAFDVTTTPDGDGAEGAFDTELSTDGLAAGDYDVVARACWGDNCGETRTTVSID